MIHVCAPVLKRYDLLKEMLQSLDSSDTPWDAHVIDNGRDATRLALALEGRRVSVFTPTEPMGVAESWNWFIDNVPEERLITNDDILFAPESLAAMVKAKTSFVSCTFGFSCFLLRDACVKAIGRFDESISPGYAYFEDMDYLRRMRQAGVADDVVQCGIIHRQSSTPAKYTDEELAAHHVKFRLAEQNYTAKWVSAPDWDQLKTIGGAGSHE